MIGPGLRAYLTACMDRMAEARMGLISIKVGAIFVTVQARRGELIALWSDRHDIIESTRLPEQLAAHNVTMADREMRSEVPLP